MSKSVAKNAMYNGIRVVCWMLFPLITYPYAARVLLADNLGKVDFAISITSYFILIAGLGITDYATREGAGIRNDRKKLDRFASEVFTINIGSTLLSYLLLAGLVLAWPHLQGYLALIAVQSLTIIGTTIGVDWIYTIEEDYGYITLRAVLVQVLSTILLFTLVKRPEDYVIYAAITVFSNVGANIFNFFRARRYATLRIVFDFDPRRHLVPMLILFGNALAVAICVNIDVTLLNVMKGDYLVGIYSLAARIYKMVKQLLNSLVLVSLPRLSLYLANGDDDKYQSLLQSISHGLLIASFPALALLFLMSNYVVFFVGGPEFMASEGALRILSLATIPTVFATYVMNSILLPHKGERFVLRSTCIGAAVNLLLNLVAIPLLGDIGAAITTVVAELSVLLSAAWCARSFCDPRSLLRQLLPHLLTVTIGVALMAAAYVPLQRAMGFSVISFFVSGGVLVALYLLVLFARRDNLALQLLHSVAGRLPRHKQQ